MPVLTAAAAPAVLRRGGSARVAAEVAAKFALGDRVVVRNLNPRGHTRVPRYIRGKTGTIECDHGGFLLPALPAPPPPRPATRRRRAGLYRTLAGASLRHDGEAPRSRTFHLGGMGECPG